METGLKIKVGADIVEATKSLAELEADFKSLNDQIKNTTDGKELVSLNKRLEELGSTIKAIKNAGKIGFDDFGAKVASQLNNIKKPAGDAANALLNFGRIAQDAPFGIIGITNNINPALESFQRLAKETGSAGAALKSMLAGLGGPAGIGIAFSVITSAATSLVMKYGSLGGAIDVLTSSLNDLQIAQRGINKTFAESSASAEAERATLNSLFDIARNTALSTDERKEAINKINSEYGRYIDNLKLETVNTEAVNSAQKKLNETLINQAKIKGVQDLITQEAKKQADLFVKLNDRLTEKNAFGKMIEAISNLNPAWAGSGINKKIADIYNIGSGFEESERKIKLFNDTLRNLLTNEAKSGNLFTEIPKKIKEKLQQTTIYIQQGLTPIEIPIKFQDEKLYKVKEVFHKIQSDLKSESFGGFKILDGNDVSEQATSAYMSFKKYWEDQAKKDPLYLGSPKISMQGIGSDYWKYFSENVKKQINNLKKLQDEARRTADFFGGPLANTIAGVFQTLANDGKLSIKILGDALKQLVIDLIAATIRAAILAVVMKALGVGGKGMSFLNLFKSNLFGGNIGAGMATGGIVPQGYPNDSFPARLSSGEAVIPLDRLNAMMNNNSNGGGVLSARVSGNDLLFVLNRTSRSQNRSGF